MRTLRARRTLEWPGGCAKVEQLAGIVGPTGFSPGAFPDHVTKEIRPMNRLRTRVALQVLVAGAMLALAGCGESKGELEGKVTFNGQPLPGGQVVVHCSKGWTDDDNAVTRSAKIESDGSYFAPNLPPGPAKVTVETTPPFKVGINPANEPKEYLGKYVPIPLNYKDVSKSGLTVEVKKGKMEYNIALTGTAEAPK
jgi:hypothetical protein